MVSREENLFYLFFFDSFLAGVTVKKKSENSLLKFGWSVHSVWQLNLSSVGSTVTPIIIGEMEMWWCPDYLFPVAESRGGII